MDSASLSRLHPRHILLPERFAVTADKSGSITDFSPNHQSITLSNPPSN
ncbi:hypothetical protein ACFOGG_03960 [Brenneria rubrifaciens]